MIFSCWPRRELPMAVIAWIHYTRIHWISCARSNQMQVYSDCNETDLPRIPTYGQTQIVHACCRSCWILLLVLLLLHSRCFRFLVFVQFVQSGSLGSFTRRVLHLHKRKGVFFLFLSSGLLTPLSRWRYWNSELASFVCCATHPGLPPFEIVPVDL